MIQKALHSQNVNMGYIPYNKKVALDGATFLYFVSKVTKSTYIMLSSTILINHKNIM